MAKKRNAPLQTIGWREWIKLPQLGIEAVKAKVDTGARSSSLHAFDVVEFDRDGVHWVRFAVHPRQRSRDGIVEAEAPILEYRMVRSSSGKATRRPVIITPICLLDETWEVELTLANRDEMGFRMLLGREAFRGRFLVDAGRSYYGGKPPKAVRLGKPAKTSNSRKRGEKKPT
ncbi:MAG: ATP-dependent zinc protease [Planctomycetota bacterium]